MSIYSDGSAFPFYADPDECYACELAPFIEGHVYMAACDGFPERPVRLLKKYKTFMLVETIPIENPDALEPMQTFKMCVTSADLLRDVTDCLDQVIERMINFPGHWYNAKHSVPWQHRRFRRTGVDCTEAPLTAKTRDADIFSKLKYCNIDDIKTEGGIDDIIKVL